MKDSFVFHRDFNNIIDALPPEKAVILLHAVSDYSMDGVVPEFDDPLLKVAFSGIVGTLDRDSDKYDEKCSKNRENGKLGGRPKENRTVIEETERLSNNRTQPNKHDTDTDSDTDTENIKHVVQKSTRPSVEDVRSYCKERNNSVDADQFVDFYTAKGWKVGNQPMKDWKAAVRTWEKRERSGTPRGKPNGFNNFEQRKYDYDDLETKLLAGGKS